MGRAKNMDRITIIASVLFSLIMLIVILTGLFSIWVFFGSLMLISLYLFGYFYVLNYFKAKEEIDRQEKSNKKKLDYCWERANHLLRNMAGGQGLEWNRGTGRRSEYESFHNGIQMCGFRSMEGYLSDTQQLVVLIYDIENDDIVRYYANPPPSILDNHFHKFKPFQGKESLGVQPPYNRPYDRRYGSRRPLSIHVGGNEDQYENLDNYQHDKKPEENVVTDSLKKINERAKKF